MAYMKDSTGRRLDAVAIPTRQEAALAAAPAQLGVLSDSLLGYGEGVPTYIELLSRQKHRFTSITGVNRILYYPGQTAATVLSHADELINLPALDRPSHIIVQGGTNDIIAATAPANVMAVLDAGYAKLEAAGIRPIISTIPPLGGAFQYSALRSPGQTLNVLLRDNAHRNGRMFVDPFDSLIDFSTARYQAAYDSGDNVHPSPAGIKAWAQRIISDLAAYPTASIDPLTYGSWNEDGFVGGTFTTGGGNFGGATPAGLSVRLGVTSPPAGYTPTLISQDGGQYFDQRITVSGAASAMSVYQATEFAVVAGQRIRAAVGVKLGQDLTGSNRLQVYIRTHSGATERGNFQMTGPLGVSRIITDGIAMTEFTVPVGATSGQMIFLIPPVNGTYDFYRPRIVNMTTAGLV